MSRDSGTLLDSERVAWRACQTPLVPAARAASGRAFLSKVSASSSLAAEPLPLGSFVA